MKKLDITIDLTKDLDYTLEQIEKAAKRIERKTLWLRIKGWF